MSSTTLKLTLEYDGTDFVGWQFQLNGRSVQEEIIKAVRRITGQEADVVGAGRTDSGVHAKGQVAHLILADPGNLRDLRYSLNAVLPEDVVIRSLVEVPADFHARFSAKERIYKYFITTERSSIERRFAWWVKYQLDLPVMRTCTEILFGEHDFRSFCRAQAEVTHHRCIVSSAGWETEEGKLVFTISADRFLHGMVRTIVGTLVNVGRGYTSPGDFQGILEAKDRTAAGFAAPPHGLFLWEIVYP